MENITWQTQEFEKHEKGGAWFAALWIITAGLVVVAILTKSLFMAVLVVVAALVISLFAAKEPRKIKVELAEKKITLDDKTQPLENFSSFWIFKEEDYEEDYNVLSLASKSFFQPHLKIILPQEQTSNVRMILRSVLEEEEQDESLIESLADWLRF